MFWKRWRLFRLCGVPVSLDASWLILGLAERFAWINPADQRHRSNSFTTGATAGSTPDAQKLLRQ
jgi:hypothetical protein